MYYVYVLINKNDILYKGYTTDIVKRILEHNSGKNKYTRNKGPWRLAYQEEHATKSEALKREIFLKSGKGREFLKNILHNGV